MRKFLVPVLAALAATGIAIPAGATSKDTREVTISVDHADLDLATSEDIETLVKRVEAAAAKACFSQVPSAVLHSRTNALCRQSLVEAAMEQIEVKRAEAFAVSPVNLAARD